MEIDRFLKLDYLVFSSHKTMTQSIKATLNGNGFDTLHAHTFGNLDLDGEQFVIFCREYLRVHGRKIAVLSVFRDPLDRMISSFFQSLSVHKFGHTHWGEDPSLRGLPPEEVRAASVLSAEDFARIQERFWYYCMIIDAWGESLDELCEALSIAPEQIAFDAAQRFTKNAYPLIDLYVTRFDILQGEFALGLETLTGRSLVEIAANQSGEKWYSESYRHFRQNLLMPALFIEHLYHARRALGEVFYKDAYPEILEERVSKFQFPA